MNLNEFNNLNVSEFSQVTQEVQPSLENPPVAESTPNSENPPPKEIAERKSDYTPKKSTKSKILSDFLPKILAVVIATSSVISTTVTSATKAVINFLSLTASASEIFYQITAENTNEDLWLYLENDFTHRKVKLSEGENSGHFENLAPNMKYELCVRKESGLFKDIKSQTIKTLSANLISEFYGFTVTPASDADENFIFTPSFENPLNAWSNISVVLTDQATIAYPEDIPKPEVNNVESGVEYTIPLSDYQFFSSKGILTAYADVKLEDGSTERQSIYSQPVEFITKRTYVQSLTVTPAEYPSGEVGFVLTYIDENEFWAGADLKLYFNSNVSGDSYEATITQSPTNSYFTLYSNFIEGDLATFELVLSITINEVYYNVYLLIENHVVKGENFVDEPNTSTGTGTGTGTDTGTDTGS